MGRPRTPRGRARLAAERLEAEFPVAECELDFETPWQLLVATILSAQCTDERVNMVTPALFDAFPDAAAVVPAPAEEIEALVKSTGFFRNKTKSIKGAALAVEERFDGEVPSTMDDLVTIPGVGRKTANVLLHVAFDEPGIAVDTHVQRLVHRLGITEETDPVKIEFAIYDLLPKRASGPFGMRLILHGRRTCKARRPDCDSCVLADFCPSAFTF